ncbi:MAG: MBG domain-containing protein, partial [Bacteroidales bacterium]
EVVATVEDPNYQGSATATFEILKAPAIVQITELETTYNGLPQQPEFTTVPEGLTLIITYNGGSNLPLNAGTYEVVATVEDLNYQGTATATFEILKAEATVQITELETTYNGSQQQPEFATIPEGLTLIITYNGGTDLPANAGTYEVVATVEDSNYAGSSSVIFVIQKVPLTIMADDKTKTYDNQVFSGFTVSFSGFISGEGPSNLLGGLVISGPAATATLAGEYTIVPGGFTSPNYHITFTEGMLVIEPAPLIVAAKNITKPEEVEYVFQGNEFTTTGLITASTDEVISVTLSSVGADASAAVGQYPILISGAQGMGLENYSITYTDGIMTVTDKIILVLAGMEASDKIYDGNTLAQITDYGELQGIDEGDEVILDTGFAVAFFANKHVGNNKPVTVSGLQLLGADADKYLLEEQFTTASITPRPLELSDFYAEDKIYDSTVSVTEAGFSDNRLEGDQLFFSFSATFESPDAGENKTVFFEDISLNGGADRLNYFLAATTGQASASILQAQIDVLADNKSKKFGEDDPILTYTITGGMLLPGNEFQGELSREPGEEVGVYDILQGNLSAGNNYQINFTMGQFSIEPAELTVVLLPQEAIAAGAQWSTDGENWYESGFALALSPGSYTLQFTQLPEDEWYSPSPLEFSHGPAAQVEVVYIPRLFLTMLEPVGEGMTNPEEGIYDFPPGTLWELTAEPGPQWEFSHWILNQEVYTDNPLSLVLTENTTAQAIFEEIIPETYTVTFNVTAVGGSPILDATVTFAGITNLPGDYVFENILAGVYSYTVSRAGYVSVSSNASITQDRTINVLLMPVTPPTYTVTFNVNDEYGEPVTHAVITFAGIVNPPGNYVFPGLSSGTYSYWVEKEGYHPATGSVNVNANLNVPVTLISTTFSLAIIHEGEGETDPPAGNYNIEKYTFIEVQAINIEGSVFTKWVVGEEEITSPIVQVFMDDNKTLVAHFEPAETFSLTIQKEGEGQTSPDEGVHFFPAGSEVSLQAIESDPTFKFSKWLVEGLEFSTPEITLLMDGPKEAIAVFIQKLFFDLVVSSSPGGTTDPVPGNYSFEENSEVNLLATPVEGYVFVKWVVNEQDYLQAELVLIMNEHKEAWALFELENSIADFDLLPGIALYPNPATEILYFQVFHWNGEGHMEIFDMQGRIVFSGYWEKLNTEQKVNVSGFLPGVYVMRLRVNNFVLEKRFIVR